MYYSFSISLVVAVIVISSPNLKPPEGVIDTKEASFTNEIVEYNEFANFDWQNCHIFFKRKASPWLCCKALESERYLWLSNKNCLLTWNLVQSSIFSFVGGLAGAAMTMTYCHCAASALFRQACLL